MEILSSTYLFKLCTYLHVVFNFYAALGYEHFKKFSSNSCPSCQFFTLPITSTSGNNTECKSKHFNIFIVM